jgi:diguanylate cyclase (GGDEF)-like protein
VPPSQETTGFELRDLHGASRSVAYLTLAASPYVLVTALLTPDVTVAGVLAVVLTSVVMAVAGVFSWRRPEGIPRMFWFVAPIVSSLMVTGLNLATNDASTGAQLFYLWPVLYTANFLGTRAIYLNLALVCAGEAAVVFTILGVGKGGADWAALSMAMAMTAAVVVSLRKRADRLRAVLEEQAHADPLTGLANRRFYDDAMGRAGDWARRTGGSVALITVDLDHFKRINDTYGHAEGDRVLQAVAAAMRTIVGPTGVAARLGGDEFVMLLHADRDAAVGVANLLRELVAATTGLAGGPPSLSIGVAVLPGDVSTVADLVTASDAALYEAKTSGRGRVSVAGDLHNVERVTRSFVSDPRP